jgi:hypothetical protein
MSLGKLKGASRNIIFLTRSQKGRDVPRLRRRSGGALPVAESAGAGQAGSTRASSKVQCDSFLPLATSQAACRCSAVSRRLRLCSCFHSARPLRSCHLSVLRLLLLRHDHSRLSTSRDAHPLPHVRLAQIYPHRHCIVQEGKWRRCNHNGTLLQSPLKEQQSPV